MALYESVRVEKASVPEEEVLDAAECRDLIASRVQEGWEFVSAVPVKEAGYGKTPAYDLVFKREEGEA